MIEYGKVKSVSYSSSKWKNRKQGKNMLLIKNRGSKSNNTNQ